MVQAYILVQTEVGKAAEVALAIGQITGVTQADDVTGPYDVIVRAESDNVDDLGRLVVAQIQSVHLIGDLAFSVETGIDERGEFSWESRRIIIDIMRPQVIKHGIPESGAEGEL